MAFGNNCFVKIWGVVDKGNFAEVEVSSNKKNRQTGEYETDFRSKFVRFVGDAYHCRPMEGQKIKIIDCTVTNAYKKDGQNMFLKNPIYTVFKYELQSDEGTPTNTGTTLLLNEVNEELPF